MGRGFLVNWELFFYVSFLLDSCLRTPLPVYSTPLRLSSLEGSLGGERDHIDGLIEATVAESAATGVRVS